MKATLEFDLPEEAQEFKDATNAQRFKHQLDEIWEQVFRPFYKHGYPDAELEELIQENSEVVEQLIDKLGDIYRQVINEET